MPRKVFVLVNPASGPKDTVQEVVEAVQEHWDTDDTEVWYQFSKSKRDGIEKIRRAADRGADTVLIAGGDGLLNSCLQALLDHELTVGVVPTGSMNGFAKHFRIPLGIPEAVRALRNGHTRQVDVATANGNPWVVTCSFAWETSVAELFDRIPARGMLPYIFSAAYTSFDYLPQPHRIRGDDGPEKTVDHPMVLTAVNVSDYGPVRLVSSAVSPEDGLVELVEVEKEDLPAVLTQIPKLIRGEIDEVPQLHCDSYSRIVVTRDKAAPIQIDGEIVDTEAEVEIEVLPSALSILVPEAEDEDQA